MEHIGPFPVTDVWHLPTHRLGQRVLVCRQLDSTNTRLLELASIPESDGLALLADEQTAGRGQHGRTWLAGPRASVLLSVLVRPSGSWCRPAVLTAWAAVSVCELIERLLLSNRHRTGDCRPRLASPTHSVRIKWPNDVLLGGRKVCGILIEQAQHGNSLSAVVGIGLNVRQSQADFSTAGLPQATSLACVGTQEDTHPIARALIEQLDHELHSAKDDLAGLEARWQQALGLLGHLVVLEHKEGTYLGHLSELTFQKIVVESESLPPLVLPPESVLHLREA
jgi:BirA family biotin operon repressor/biotin-[acetyl-CoA-carboxylase] ligase